MEPANFISMLQEKGITLVADVRSVPRTEFAPRFNRDALEPLLTENKLKYEPMAEPFGARRNNPAMLDADGKVNYDKVRKSAEFQKGMARIRALMLEGEIPVLMCAEANPMICHRFSMISLAMQDAGLNVRHILRNRSVVENGLLEQELLTKFADKLPQPDMFRPIVSTDDKIRLVYRLQNKAVAKSALEGSRK